VRSLPGRGLVTTVGVHPTRCLAITEASEADRGMDGYLSQLQQVRTHRPSMNLMAVVELCLCQRGTGCPATHVVVGPLRVRCCVRFCEYPVVPAGPAPILTRFFPSRSPISCLSPMRTTGYVCCDAPQLAVEGAAEKLVVAIGECGLDWDRTRGCTCGHIMIAPDVALLFMHLHVSPCTNWQL
jgi:hypothetical protein